MKRRITAVRPRRTPTMRSYSQFCGLARALDVIGERWTLLIVRDLLIHPRRYSDLQASLPAIASNILSERLRELMTAGVIRQTRIELPAPATLYELTPFGRGLEPTIAALIRWSAPLMTSGRGRDTFDAKWLVVAFRALLSPRVATGVDVEIELCVDAARIVVAVRDGDLTVAATHLTSPDVLSVRLSGEHALQLATGSVTLAALLRSGRASVQAGRGVTAASRVLSAAARRETA